MFDAIITEPDLFPILRETCEENNICVKICDDLMENGELKENLIKILKVDGYYNSKNMHNPPPSIDCLIIIKTGENKFGLTLIELKNVSSPKGLNRKNIRSKFNTAINDFLSQLFSNIFLNDDYEISYFRLWLVTNPYRWPPMSEEQFSKKVKGTALDLFLSEKPYKFRGKIATIKHKPPNIEVCN
jgi:hypothetical protein